MKMGGGELTKTKDMGERLLETHYLARHGSILL